MNCRCGKKAENFGHCVECWLRLCNWIYYVNHTEEIHEHSPKKRPRLGKRL